MILQDTANAETTNAYQNYISGRDSTGLETWWVGEGSPSGKVVGLYASRPGYDLYLGAGGAEGLRVASTGNVGIGTTAPGSKLEIGTNASASTPTLLGLYNSSNAANSGSSLSFFIADGSSNKDEFANISTVVKNGLNGSEDAFFSIKTIVDGILTDRLVINDAGNVGIGTTIPSDKLHVVGSAKISTLASAGTRCVHADSNGVLSVTGSDCGSGSGSVTGVSASGAILSSGGTAPVITLDYDNATVGINGSNKLIVKSGGITDTQVGTGIDAAKLNTGVVSNAEYNFLDGVTSAIQTQLNAKQSSITTGTTAQYLRGDLSLSTFSNDVLGTLLTGYSASNATILSTDSVLIGFNKAQGQITNIATNYIPKTGGTLSVGTINGVPTPVLADDVVNKGYVDSSVASASTALWSLAAGNIYRSTGNVGVGTTAAGAKLDVRDTGNYSGEGNSFYVSNGATTPPKIVQMGYDNTIDAGFIRAFHSATGTKNLVLQPTGGNLGIGTTVPNPAAISSWAPVVTVGPISTDKAAIVELQTNTNSTSTGAGALVVRNTNSGSAETRLGQIQVSTDAALNSGVISFHTTNAGTISERMRISASGNVGVGTTIPAKKLHVGGDIQFDGLETSTLKKQYTFNIPHADAIAGNSMKYTFSQYFSGKIKVYTQRNTDAGAGLYYEADVQFDTNNATSPYTPQFQFVRESKNNASNGLSVQVYIDDHTGVDANSTMTVKMSHTGNSYAYYVEFDCLCTTPTALYDTSAAVGTLKTPELTESSSGIAIGTTSPVNKIHINDTNAGIRLTSATTGQTTADGIFIGNDGTDKFVLAQKENQPMIFETNSTERMRLQPSGGLSVGTNPTNALSFDLQLDKFFSIWSADENESYLLHNTYYSAGWKYRESTAGAGATVVNMGGGRFSVATAVDGTQDATITWLQGLHIDSAGLVGLGTTTPTSKLHVFGVNADIGMNSSDVNAVGLLSNGAGRGSSRQAIYFNSDGSASLNDMYLGSAYELVDGVSSAAPTFKNAGSASVVPNIMAIGHNGFRFMSGSVAAVGTALTPTETMRLTSSGNLGIGTTTPGSKLHVQTNTGGVVGQFYYGQANDDLGAATQSNTLLLLRDITYATTGGKSNSQILWSDANSYENAAIGVEHNAFNNGSSSLTFSTAPNNAGAVERMRINSSGNVGIGTTPPSGILNTRSTSGIYIDRTENSASIANHLVFRRGTGAGNFSSISTTGDAANGTSDLLLATDGVERFRVTASGNVGIGTTTPLSRLELASINSGATLDSGEAFFRIKNTTTAANARFGLGFVAGDSSNPGATIAAKQLNSNGGASLLFTTRNTAGTHTDRMFLDSEGNVGIGTTTPLANLHVRSLGTMAYSGTATKGLFLTTPDAAGSTNYTGIAISAPYATGTAMEGVMRMNRGSSDIYNGMEIGSITNHPLRFITNASTENGQERMRILANGNVGIGTITPTSKLQVIGGEIQIPRSIYGFKTGNYGSYQEIETAAGNFGAGATALMQNAIYDNTDARWEFLTSAHGGRATMFGSHIGNFMFQTASGGAAAGDPITWNERMRIDNSGNVGIGTTAPAHPLHVIGTAGLSTGTAWTNTSDRRLKDIHGAYEYGLDEILKLDVVKFSYKANNPLGLPSDREIVGFVAQDVEKVIPEAIVRRDDGYLELNVDPIHWAGINAIKELNTIVAKNVEMFMVMHKGLEARVSEAERKIASLDEKNKKLEHKVEKLEKQNQELREAICAINPRAKICR
jgi:hypothetical protein